ncbi:hypothetical protein MSG28_004689 [Choristoneura fumiferana]|uniref:Uncharacterized protein n=1 Tax=Choristoneura fumiferana TaxID=7141 RepID=A0ACC0K7Q1_CHOFU|nr:hypothetical protein MSG28_004689 [Choristoneura fumiferana]
MLLALELFDNKQYAQAMDEFGKLNTDPADVIKLFPELDNKPGGKNGKLKAEDLEKALNALVKYLLELRSRKSSASEASGSQDDPSQRNVMQQLELIDITLLKCYLQINDALIAPLLRLNNCRLEEAEKILVAHGKHSELVILYQTKGQHLKALQLLKEQAKQPDSSLKGYNMTRRAEHVNLIFKFSDWIIRDYPEEGLKIFTEDKIEVETLPRPKALSVLPDSVPLARLKTFLESALDNQLSLKRKTQVLKGLLYAENQQVQELKQFHESKSVIINDYNVCPVCKKRFGNQSAFVRYPNGDIVHYSCRLEQAAVRQ